MRWTAVCMVWLVTVWILPVSAERVVIVSEGQPVVTVVLPTDAAPDLEQAAAELSSTVEKLSGVALPVHRGDGGVQTPVLRLDDEQAPLPPVAPPREQAGLEAFSIRVDGGSVYFGGRSPETVAYAVYAFIEDDLGVRWFAPGDLWEHLPATEPGELAVDVSGRVLVPDTPLRVWSGHGYVASWQQWDRRNRAQSRTRAVRHRAGNQLQEAFPSEVYGETHPEYYPLIRGERFIPPPGRLGREDRFWPCSSNPEVVRVAAEFIRSWFDEDPGDRRSFSMGMDDVTNLCECEECLALDPPGAREQDNYSDRYYAFVNAVAAEVKKTHPDHYIGVLIYRQLRRPPVNVPRMEDNVYGFITQNCGTWWNPGAEEADKALTRDWAGRFTLPLARYEYYGLGTFTPRFYPHTMDRQIKFDQELGFDAQYTELYTFLPHTAPMVWAFSKLQWDASLDADALLGEFCEKMFGAAAPAMAEYYDLLERAWNTPRPGRVADFTTAAGMLAVSRNAGEQVLAISPEEIRAGLAVLDRAVEQAGDPRALQRIGIVREALVFSQHGIESYLRNRELRAMTVASEQDVAGAMAALEQYAWMITGRNRIWSAARGRSDLLGETVRGLGDTYNYLVIDEFPQMDTTVASLVLDVLEWTRSNAPDGAREVAETVRSIPWPEGVGFVMDAVAGAQDRENLLRNADLEATGEAPTEGARADWTHEGAPEHWSVWLRSVPSVVPVSRAGALDGAGREESRGMVFHHGQGGALIQSLPARPGETFLCTAWMRGMASAETRGRGHSGADAAPHGHILVRFRDAEGRLFSGADRRLHANRVVGVPTDDWQRLVLAFTVPQRAEAVVMMLGADPLATPGLSVAFDNAALQRVSAAEVPVALGGGAGANLVGNAGFEVADPVAGGPAGWTIRDWGVEKGFVTLEQSDDARSGAVAGRVRMTDAENVVVSPSLVQPVRGAQTLRFSCWYKLPEPGEVYLSVVTHARDGRRLQYLSSPPQATVGQWAELAYEFRTEADTHSLFLYLRPNVDGLLLDEVSLVIETPPDVSMLKWNPQTVAEELKRYEPVLAEFGIKDPLRWARAQMEQEQDWAARQGWWERRIAHWRFMLLGEAPEDWARWLNLDHPALADHRAELRAGGTRARQAWANHVRAAKPDLAQVCADPGSRSALFQPDGNDMYTPEGTFIPDRAEALLEGKVYSLSLPVVTGEPDYGWVQTANNAAWFVQYLSLAYYHQQDPRWVEEFQNQVMAMVLGWEIAGYWAPAARVSMILPAYLIMKDSPVMSDRFHGICSRWLWAHARQLHSTGATAYRDNTLCWSGLGQWLAASLFPEFNGSERWREDLWPLYVAGWRRELLDDHCHEHRALAYHTNFIRRALALMSVADAQGVADELPAEFRELVEGTVDVFIKMSTPIRSTPGVNDDVTVTWDHGPLLRLAADLCRREDWRYVATDGGEGVAPPYRSVLLPAAQLVAFRSDWSPDALWGFFKVSPEKGHHHRDTLGIQIWAGGRKLLAEPYTGDYDSERDVYNRSWWHSTPTVGETLLPIRDEHPRVLHWETGEDLDYAVGELLVPTVHYPAAEQPPRRFQGLPVLVNEPIGEGPDPARFRRHVFFVDRSWWLIWDEFSDVPAHREIWENFHFATRDLEVDEAAGSVMTRFADGANLRMQTTMPGWGIQVEDTRMWPKYGHDTVPTATVHFAAPAGTAHEGFGALFTIFHGPQAPADTAFEGVERLADGRVRLRVRVAGEARALITQSFAGE